MDSASDPSDTQLRRLDLNLLLIFQSIVRHRKLAMAADELGLTKSGVSHAVNRLRDIFGDELFVRYRAGVRLTHRAQLLAPKVTRIVELASDMLMLERHFDPATDQRHFRLGTVEYGAMLLGPRLAERLRVEAPNMRLVIQAMRRDELIDQVNNHSLDLAISSFFGGVGDLHAETLYDELYVVAARQAHPATTPKLTAKSYIAAEHVVAMIESRPPVILESSFAKLGLTRKVAVSVPSYLAGFAVAERTDYLLTVHERLAQRFAPQFGLEIHQLPFEEVHVAATMISHPMSEHDPGFQWFRKLVRGVTAELFDAQGAPSRD